jgi:hypothetical protein
MYEAWITRWRANFPMAQGLCQMAAKKMVAAFPELRVAQGWAVVPAVNGLARQQPIPGAVMVVGQRVRITHWWCVASDGSVWDPTGDQFTMIYEYIEAKP